MKIKKNHREIVTSVISLSLIFLLFNVARANMPSSSYRFDVFSDSYFSVFFALWSLTAAIEIALGFFLFFRNLRGAITILFANLISYPLFFIWMYFASLYFGIPSIYNNHIFLPEQYALLIGEIGVIFFEALLIKLVLREKITFKYSFLISFTLNLVTVIIGLILNYLFSG